MGWTGRISGLWARLNARNQKGCDSMRSSLVYQSVKAEVGQNRKNIVNRLTICPLMFHTCHIAARQWEP